MKKVIVVISLLALLAATNTYSFLEGRKNGVRYALGDVVMIGNLLRKTIEEENLEGARKMVISLMMYADVMIESYPGRPIGDTQRANFPYTDKIMNEYKEEYGAEWERYDTTEAPRN